MQLPTPAKSGLKRKLGFDRRGPQSGTQISDSEYDLEGDTIAVDEATPAKKRRVGEGLVYVGDRETTASQLHEERDLLEGDTLGVDDTELMACSGVESGAEGSDIANDEPNVCDDADVESQITTDDLGADGDDEVLLMHPRPDKVNRGSKTSCDTDGTYHPSPHAVDKNLTKSIVHQAVENELSEEEVVGKQHIVSKNERKEVAFDFSLERAERWVAAIKLPKGHWAEAEEDLFYRLAMRGFEPLVPSNWQLDFSTLPESLFGLPGDITPPYINATGGSNFRGKTTYIQNLSRTLLFSYHYFFKLTVCQLSMLSPISLSLAVKSGTANQSTFAPSQLSVAPLRDILNGHYMILTSSIVQMQFPFTLYILLNHPNPLAMPSKP